MSSSNQPHPNSEHDAAASSDQKQLAERLQSQEVVAAVNDYNSGPQAGSSFVSPNKTEPARSMAHSTDKEITSSYAADETQN